MGNRVPMPVLPAPPYKLHRGCRIEVRLRVPGAVMEFLPVSLINAVMGLVDVLNLAWPERWQA